MRSFPLKYKLDKKVYNFFRYFFFKIDSERIHEILVSLGEFLGKITTVKKIITKFYKFESQSLNQKILGINFPNPIGLAAGFDYDAKLTQFTPSLGFGFQSIGSITYKPYEGNEPPRLARLPKSLSLVVNKGLKNSGASEITQKLKKMNFEIPIGISVAKTNCKQTANQKEGIDDYVSTFKILKKISVGSYYELNISCPNTFGGEPFTTPKKLSALLKRIDSLKLTKPIFLKMPVDFSEEETRELCEVAKNHKIEGLIFGNLTKNKNNPVFDKNEIENAPKGNFSGLPTKEKSNRLIEFAYKNYKKRFIIIGCGGVFSAEDAYEKIKLGASLIQMITGLVYEGPGIVSRINYDLAELLKRDGFKNISEAIGTGNKANLYK